MIPVNNLLHLTKAELYSGPAYRFRTCKASEVIAVITRDIIPRVTMLGAKSVHTVLVFPVVWLPCSPEPETAYFFVGPNERSFYTSIIESNPASIAVMTVLNVDIFFLVVNRHQIRTHWRTVWFSGQPYGACGTCEVAVAIKVTPSWLTYVCACKEKRTCV